MEQRIVTMSYQHRVQPWLIACFGAQVAYDMTERCDRFIEEAIELAQSVGHSAERAHALVDYVYGRPKGEPEQEVGGVMVTLAALCLAANMDMRAAGDKELDRIWTKIDAIRAKQAAKPRGSALPIARAQPEARVLTCVYCGHEYPQNTPAWGDAVLTEHIAQCDKHPMRAIEKECERLRAEAAAMLFGPPIPYSPGDELQADVVLAILCLDGCSCGAEIVTRETIKRYDGSVSHYCVPTRRLTRG